MDTTAFDNWITGTFRRKDEPKTRALHRFEVEHDISQMTLRRAMAGKPLRAATARRLAEITGLDAGGLALGCDPKDSSPDSVPATKVA